MGYFLQNACKSACMPHRPDIFGSTRGDDRGGGGGAMFVAMATTFALGAKSNRLPACFQSSRSRDRDRDSRFLDLDRDRDFDI